jgi:hypothetical protein
VSEQARHFGNEMRVAAAHDTTDPAHQGEGRSVTLISGHYPD